MKADANLDGSVDVADFNIWNANKFSIGTGWCSGDFNADGGVDVADFNLWNANKFQSADTAARSSSVAIGQFALRKSLKAERRNQTEILGADILRARGDLFELR